MAPARRQSMIRRPTNPFLITHAPNVPSHPLRPPNARSRQLQVLYNELQEHNSNGEMVSYNIATDSWVPWTRPVRTLLSGAMTAVAASGFRNLNATGPDGYEPPCCPHAADVSKGDQYSRMDLHLRRKYQGRTVDFFQVPRTSHICPFVVVIPSLQPPQVLYTQEEIDEHSVLYGPEEAAELRDIHLNYDRDFLQDFEDASSPSKASTSSSFEVDEMLNFIPDCGSSATSSSSPFHSSPTVSALQRRRLFAAAPKKNDPRKPGYNPRILPDLTFGEGTLVSPRPLPSTRRGAAAFFSLEVAAARMNSDTAMMTTLDSNEVLGVYRANPDEHPAWDAIHTPLVLQPYDSRLYPSCTNRTFQNLSFLDTVVGRVIRELNSTLGIPEATLRSLKEVGVKCDSCFCMYSPEGYNAHVRDNKCRNSTFSREIRHRESDIETLQGLKLRENANHGGVHITEFDETPIGIAYLEFNSAIGIPADVWIMISTAYVQCTTCHLVRTFPAHRGHLDPHGTCQDLGEGTATLDKGKGRAEPAPIGSPATERDTESG